MPYVPTQDHFRAVQRALSLLIAVNTERWFSRADLFGPSNAAEAFWQKRVLLRLQTAGVLNARAGRAGPHSSNVKYYRFPHIPSDRRFALNQCGPLLSVKVSKALQALVADNDPEAWRHVEVEPMRPLPEQPKKVLAPEKPSEAPSHTSSPKVAPLFDLDALRNMNEEERQFVLISNVLFLRDSLYQPDKEVPDRIWAIEQQLVLFIDSLVTVIQQNEQILARLDLLETTGAPRTPTLDRCKTFVTPERDSNA